jgi:DNA-binding CsgD family transcriptional regulator
MSNETDEIAHLRQLSARFRRLAASGTSISAELNEIADQVSARADQLEQVAKAPHQHNGVSLASKDWQSKRPLTQREREVLCLVAQGKTGKEISDIIKITERTVVSHAGSAMKKLKASNRAQAVAIATRNRLLGSE